MRNAPDVDMRCLEMNPGAARNVGANLIHWTKQRTNAETQMPRS